MQLLWDIQLSWMGLEVVEPALERSRWSGMEVCLVPDTGHLPGRDPGSSGDGSTRSGLSTVAVHRYAAHVP